MRRRIVSVWLPRFDADLAARRAPGLADRPLAFYRETGGLLILTACNAAAAGMGVTPGMVLADARALAADLTTMEDRPARRRHGLKALRRWLDRFTPLVAIDGEDGFFLDVTGVAHLFGGERRLLDMLILRVEDLGFAVAAALADSAGAAWALARHGPHGTVAASGKTRAALEDLPAEALRLEPATARRLRRLGITRIGELADLPRPALVRRFGIETVTRLDQALDAAPEPISPSALPAPARVRLTFAEPLTTRSAIETALAHLTDRLITRLDRTGDGAAALEFAIQRLDGGRQALEARAAEATRDASRIRRLFAEKLDAIDPGFGIEAASLAALRTGPVAARQTDGFGPKAPPDALARLIDMLGGRIGFNAVSRFAPTASWLPDQSFRLEPMTPASPPDAEWPDPPGPRPLLLMKRPLAIEVEAGPPPLAPPRMIGRAGRRRAVAAAWGPERIAPEWREEDPAWPAARDYWRAEEEDGDRLWLYREGDRWFLHGFFP